MGVGLVINAKPPQDVLPWPTSDCWIVDLIGKLQHKGIRVDRIPVSPTNSVRGFKRYEVLTDGKLSTFHLLRSPYWFQDGKHPYGATTLSVARLRELEFVIVAQRIADYAPVDFLIPAHEIRKLYSSGRFIRLSIPVEKLPVYNHRFPRLDFWRYELK
jgi:hypothetical protein